MRLEDYEAVVEDILLDVPPHARLHGLVIGRRIVMRARRKEA